MYHVCRDYQVVLDQLDHQESLDPQAQRVQLETLVREENLATLAAWVSLERMVHKDLQDQWYVITQHGRLPQSFCHMPIVYQLREEPSSWRLMCLTDCTLQLTSSPISQDYLHRPVA